jgi:hypothetical protein
MARAAHAAPNACLSVGKRLPSPNDDSLYGVSTERGDQAAA